MKKLWQLFLIMSTALCLTYCSQPSKDASNVIRVGTIAGPETQLMEVAKKVAAEQGVDIKIVQFTDYVLPNQALADGSIDANVYQHLPYLEAAIATKGYRLSPIGKTFIYPMGIYSTKISHLNELKTGATVAIPNDPSNEARALMLLERAGLIKLKPNVTIKATPHDILENPKQIKIRELDAAQLPRVLKDVDLTTINTNYAMEVGLLPSRDAVWVESNNSPYANLIVVKTADQNNAKFITLVEALHSPEVLAKAKALFKGQAVPAWTK